MKFDRRIKTDVHINLTPLIDVILMLVIFFMVATIFRVGPGIAMDLPQSTTSQNVSLTEFHVKVVSEQEIYVDRDHVQLSGLDAEIVKQLNGKDIKKLRVVVEGGYDTPYQLVVSVLDVLRKNKITGVNLLTKLGKAP